LNKHRAPPRFLRCAKRLSSRNGKNRALRRCRGSFDQKNALEFDYSAFYRKTGIGDPLLCPGGIIRRRAKAAVIQTRIGNHTFRATGITAYLTLKNSGKLEVAQQIANHESPRTTKLYDRRNDEISLDEMERIAI
jgi:integrase